MKKSKIDYTTIGSVGGMSADAFKQWVKDSGIDVDDLDELRGMMLITLEQYNAAYDNAKANELKRQYDRAMGVI